MKLTVARAHQERLHATLTDGLGARSVCPEPDFTVYTLADDFNVGVYVVDDHEALGEEDQVKAPWLELLVDDLDAARGRLEGLGVAVVPYPRDPEHRYYRLPGGPVFRLASPS